MKADLHIHTEFSCDSKTGIKAYMDKAIELGMQILCFTDHVDFNENDYGYGYYKPKCFFESFNSLKESYSGEIKIYSGIEFGETHLYAEQLKELSSYPYDFVIGSIHWIGSMFPSQKIKEKYSIKEFYSLYWDEVLKMAKHGGFDALGHIDFPKRYCGEIYYSEEKINEIFKYILEKDSVIEINTSSLRKGYSETMPGNELLEIYKANGGKYVTIGSDAHEVKDLGSDIHAAKEIIKKLSLQEVVYENRQRILVNQTVI